MSDWKQNILDKLIERDEKHRQIVGCYDTLHYMNKKIEEYDERCKQLKSENTLFELDKALNQIKELNKKIELDKQIIKEKETVNNDLIVAFGSAKKDRESIREMYLKLENKNKKLLEEMAMSKKTISMINDHVLELQFENNMLHASLEAMK